MRVVLPFHHENVPDELRALSQWVLWDNVQGKKVPRRPNAPTKSALVNKPWTWSTYDHVVAEHNRTGLGGGFVFTESDPYVFIDLDWKHTGSPSQLQLEILDTLGTSYAETSPSGKGAHIFTRANKNVILKGAKVDPIGVEIYLRGRYSTVTGAISDYGNRGISDSTKQISEIIREVESHRIRRGTRNNTLTRQAGKHRHQGKDSSTINAELQNTNNLLCDPPLPESEVKGIARSVAAYDVSGFVMLPRSLIYSDAFDNLSARAVKLYVQIAASHTGNNNGQLTAVYDHYWERGWKSQTTFYKARNELLDAGILVRTEKAHSRRASQFALRHLEQKHP